MSGLSRDWVEKTIAFHGHWCPGLAIGIRAAELALRKLGRPEAAELAAVVETDMCGVDAVQVLTGCTFGKGNLVHRDYGKMAFSFFDRKTGKGFRAVLKPEIQEEMATEIGPLMKKMNEGTITRGREKDIGGLSGDPKRNVYAGRPGRHVCGQRTDSPRHLDRPVSFRACAVRPAAR